MFNDRNFDVCIIFGMFRNHARNVPLSHNTVECAAMKFSEN
jgi:hypothetical protein